MGAALLRTSALGGGTLIGLDRRYALEMVQGSDVLVEYDKLIDRQLERAAITSISGFAKLFTGAAKVLKLKWRLRPEVRSEDCEDAFILACAWLALAGLAAGETGGGRFTAGEVTIQEGDGAARAAALRLQAETVLGPWLADRGFAFQGVPG